MWKFSKGRNAEAVASGGKWFSQAAMPAKQG
jgi:hypothetical protein